MKCEASLDSEQRPWWTLDQLAERWQLNKGLLYKMLQDGRLSGQHFGKYVRVSAAEVERFEGGDGDD